MLKVQCKEYRKNSEENLSCLAEASVLNRKARHWFVIHKSSLLHSDLFKDCTFSLEDTYLKCSSEDIGEQNEAPIMQGEMVSDLLHHFGAHKTVGLNGIQPRILREVHKCSLSHLPSFIISPG